MKAKPLTYLTQAFAAWLRFALIEVHRARFLSLVHIL
jgi:hypothetical protein